VPFSISSTAGIGSEGRKRGSKKTAKPARTTRAANIKSGFDFICLVEKFFSVLLVLGVCAEKTHASIPMSLWLFDAVLLGINE
jgi:hypothetical protein